jgi:hypothetical protein
MTNRLSHSQLTKYARCGKEYEYWYIRRLRPQTQSAALLFGSAIDAAITATLLHQRDPHTEFDTAWTTGEVNGALTDLKTSPDLVYASTDLDMELLTSDDIRELGEPAEKIEALNKLKKKKGFENLKLSEKLLLNHAHWLSLSRKGHLMLTALQTKIFPNITEVLEVQKKFSFKNAEGDEIIGFIDAIIRYKGYDKPIIFDWKTSAREYELDEVRTSPQLAMYLHTQSALYENTRLCGFGVMMKGIKKNRVKICSVCGHEGKGAHKTCDAAISMAPKKGAGGSGFVRCGGAWNETIKPEALVQIIIDEVPLQSENIVLDNADYINHAIKHKLFHRNFGACKQPWGLCDFYNLCWKGKTDGLTEKK